MQTEKSTSIDWNQQIRKYDLYITNQCQAGCPSCSRFVQDNLGEFVCNSGQPYEWFDQKGLYEVHKHLSMDHVPFEKLKQWIEDNVPSGTKHTVKLCGEFGDPAMHPHLMELVQVIQRRRNFVQIVTNGGLRNKHWWQKLAETIRLGKITFSIDGATAETNLKYRKRVNFDRAMENMIAVAQLDDRKVEWDYLIFSWNWEELPQALRIADRHSIQLNAKFQNRKYGQLTDQQHDKAKEIIHKHKDGIIEDIKPATPKVDNFKLLTNPAGQLSWRDQLKVIDIYITNQCQAGCPSCSRFDMTNSYLDAWLEDPTKPYKDYPYKVWEPLGMDHVSYDTIRKWLSTNIPRGWMMTIKLCGEFGDPMMHPRIKEILTFIQQRQQNKLLLHTNGGLRSAEWWRALPEVLQRAEVVFSIDGTTEEINSLYRKRVNFDRAMSNMIAFAEAIRGRETIGCGWDYLIFDWNWHQIPEAARIAKEYDIEMDFKFQNREYGLISEENRKNAQELLNAL